MSLLHEQYEVDGDLVLFRCTECGYISMSLGWLHAHIEKHRGYTRFNIQLPLTKTSPGEFDQLLERTDIITVTDTSEISYERFDGSAEEPELRADGGSLIDKPVIGYVIGPVGDKVTVCADCAEPDDDSQPIHDSEAYGDQVPHPECWICEEVMRREDEGEEEFVTDGGQTTHTQSGRLNIISTLKKKAHRLLTYSYEKPCGCSYRVKSKPLFEQDAPRTEEIECDLVVVFEREYTNCTRREEEWERRLRCLDCGSEYTTRDKSSTCTDYGEENPDAGIKLEMKSMRPAALGGYRTQWEEVPVVEEPAEEGNDVEE